MPLVLALLALAAPAASSQTATLTLKGPPTTAYGHRIDFAGRLVPAAPGTRVSLFRGSRFVTAGSIRSDGTFRLRVQVSSPGPFTARWDGVSSNPVTVRILPRLETSLVGARTVGAKLTLLARIEPATAGPLRIRVRRGGRTTLDQLFYGSAQVELGTDRRVDLDVVVRTEPHSSFIPVSRALHVILAPARLSLGQAGPTVLELTRQLHALHYATPAPSTSFGPDLLDSVYAFEKVQGLDRTGIADAQFWSRLASPRLPAPRYTDPADHIEVDKAHQVLFIVRGGQIALIAPVSTAGIPGYYTPV